MTAFLVRLGLGGIGLKGWAWLGTAIVALGFLIWLCTTLYMAGVNAERVKILTDKIADIQAKLEANDEIRRQSDADAARAEAEADRLKELLETMSNDKSCPLSKSHVDGIGKIDNAK